MFCRAGLDYPSSSAKQILSCASQVRWPMSVRKGWWVPYQIVRAFVEGVQTCSAAWCVAAQLSHVGNLLQFRPSIELKETLLHEMIHAWMFLGKIRDQGDHGPRFQERLNFINRASFADHQARLAHTAQKQSAHRW